MAKRFTVAELVIGVTADLRDVRKSLKEGTTDIKKFSQEASTSLGEAQKFGIGLAAIAGILVGTGALAVKVFAELEQSIANTASVTGSTTMEMKRLEEFARKMGKETVFTATQAAEAMYFLASAGYNTRQIFSSLQPILALSAATQYDLADATATVVSTLRAFNMEANQAGRIANVFASAISSSQATMLKLQESMKYISPVASKLGYDIESTVAALSLLFDSGLEASMAGTQLRMALIRLQKPSNQARQAMRSLGLVIDDLNPAIHSLSDIIQKLEDANAGAAKRGKEMAEIFGVRSVNAMNILMAAGSETMDVMQAKITGTTKAADMQQRQIDTLKGTWRLMTSAIQESGLNIGSVLEPAIKAVTESIRSLNLWFSGLSDTTKKMIVVTMSLTTVFISASAIIALLISKIPFLVAGWRFLNLSFAASIGPITAVIAGVTALIAGLVYLSSAQERASRQHKTIMADLSNSISTRERELLTVQSLAKAYMKLSTQLEGNETKQKRIRNVVRDLNNIHPELISNEISYEKQLDRVASIAADVADELVQVRIAKQRIATIKLHDDIADVNKEIKDMVKQLEDVSGIFAVWSYFVKSLKTDGFDPLNGSLEEFHKDLGEVSPLFAKIAKESIMLKKIGGKIGLDMDRIGNIFKKIISDEKKLVDLKKDEESLIRKITEKELELSTLLTVKFRENRELTKDERDRIKILEVIVKFERMFGDELSRVVSLGEGLNDKFKELNDLTKSSFENIKKFKTLLDEGMFPEDATVRKEAISREKLLYDIAAAGINDVTRLRKMEDELWHKQKIADLMDQGLKENQARDTLKAAYANKMRNTDIRNQEEINSLLFVLQEKGLTNIFQMKLEKAKQERDKLLRSAQRLGLSGVEVEKAFQKEITKIKINEERLRNQLLNDILNQTMIEKAEVIRNAKDKEIALETVKNQQIVQNIKKSEGEQGDLIIQGQLDRETSEKNINARIDAERIRHSSKLLNIETDHLEQIRFASEEAKAQRIASLAITETSDLRERLLEEEKSYNVQRINEIKSNFATMLKQVEEGDLTLEEANLTHNAALEAQDIDYENRKRDIKLSFVEQEAEEQLALLDKDSELYQSRLAIYRDFLVSQLDMFNKNSDEFESRMNKIKALNKEINDFARKDSDKTASMMMKGFEIIGIAAGKAGQKQTDAWKEAAKSGIKVLIDSLVTEAKARALTALANPIGGAALAAKWGAAVMGLRALEHVAYGRIEAAKTGGIVKQGGIAEVHAGETIVPKIGSSYLSDPTGIGAATLQRSSFQTYMDNLMNATTLGKVDKKNGISSIDNGPVKRDVVEINMQMNINAEGSILTGDLDAQDAFYERVIKPAEERLKESVGDYIDERVVR